MSERIDKYAAANILGIRPRLVVEMATSGRLAAAGAAKIARAWSFDERKLRAMVKLREEEACKTAQDRVDARVVLPRVAIGAAKLSGRASKYVGRNSEDHLKQMMSELQRSVAQPSKKNSRRSGAATRA
jgi:hypothetical protein